MSSTRCSVVFGIDLVLCVIFILGLLFLYDCRLALCVVLFLFFALVDKIAFLGLLYGSCGGIMGYMDKNKSLPGEERLCPLFYYVALFAFFALYNEVILYSC